MTDYTIQDFEKANYAIAVKPGDADAIRNPSEKIWRLSNGLVKMSDAEIQRRGKWTPVKVQAPRPLTPDAITDEMVERGMTFWRMAFPYETTRESMTSLLEAALTDPPARPEGAERWEDFLIDSLDYQSLTAQQIADLADRIAEEMNR
ncbi:hypothetical protein HMPREF3159_03590 [Brachybacterium sp. HMSC06H03]|uniref:hypothetical protein n=1 Tax=Brachybacterium sp. HMSC06H03 TaxID=1581127 RepID=UPI0008A101AD|nr:hypothetical protein [Brachybacterium sp. HMSC06H03]OFT62608.1 hypothetical protein HMPREF3159_03590 [Brachybacterium sp. HMSC06H03]